MFKILLSIYVSFLALTSYSQSPPVDWTGPSDLVIEDPNKVVADLTPRVTESSKIILTWMVNGPLPKFFAIERSDNGKSFEVVSVLNNVTRLNSFQWTDDFPKKGRSFYRIRYTFDNTDSLYSKTIPVTIEGYVAFKFYPNPVDHVLIIRSEAPLDVIITDAAGRVRISDTRVQGLHTINVSSLEKGIYLIRFINKLTNVMSQEKLVKN